MEQVSRQPVEAYTREHTLRDDHAKGNAIRLLGRHLEHLGRQTPWARLIKELVAHFTQQNGKVGLAFVECDEEVLGGKEEGNEFEAFARFGEEFTELGEARHF